MQFFLFLQFSLQVLCDHFTLFTCDYLTEKQVSQPAYLQQAIQLQIKELDERPQDYFQVGLKTIDQLFAKKQLQGQVIAFRKPDSSILLTAPYFKLVLLFMVPFIRQFMLYYTKWASNYRASSQFILQWRKWTPFVPLIPSRLGLQNQQTPFQSCPLLSQLIIVILQANYSVVLSRDSNSQYSSVEKTILKRIEEGVHYTFLQEIKEHEKNPQSLGQPYVYWLFRQNHSLQQGKVIMDSISLTISIFILKKQKFLTLLTDSSVVKISRGVRFEASEQMISY